jgi:tetratricopeptide (TPR) repeat protein
MAAKNYERAVGLLRPTLATFAEEEDYYGFDLAERNLASALSGIPGNTEEVDRLIDNISKRATTSFDSRRQRAWICNILTRRYREASRFADAKMAAMEAIEISEALGDASLRAITYINLGNIATDEEDVPAALAAYSEAANAASGQNLTMESGERFPPRLSRASLSHAHRDIHRRLAG